MSLTISAKKSDGTFSYQVHNGTDLIEAGDGYPSPMDAEAAARICYHELHRRNFIWTEAFFQNDYMDLDAIMAEMD